MAYDSPSLSKAVNLLMCELHSPGIDVDPNLSKLLRDLRSSVKSLTIFENIFCGAMTGSVVIQDEMALSTMVPFVGIEQLWVVFSVYDALTGTTRTYGTMSEPLKFNIYAQTNRSLVTQGAEVYELKLVTPEVYASSELKISKAYVDQKVESIVQDLITNKIGSRKPFVTMETTQTPTTFVMPYLTPLEAIRVLTLFGQSTNGDTNYVFYETLDGFHFRSIRHMIREGQPTPTKPVPKITKVLAGTQEQRSTKNQLFADEMELVSGYDFLFLLSQGYFASTTYKVDVLDGSYAASVTRSSDATFASRSLVNGTQSLPIYPSVLGSVGNPAAKLMVVPTTKFSLQNPKLAADAQIRDNYIATTVAGRSRELLALQTRTARVRVSGAPELHAGSLVDLTFPTPVNNGVAGRPSVDIASGRYLIVAAQHTLINTGTGDFVYETIFEAGTDSVPRG